MKKTTNTSKMARPIIFLLLMFSCDMIHQCTSVDTLPLVPLREVKEKIHRYHFLLALDNSTQALIQNLSWLYRNESCLIIGLYKPHITDEEDIRWSKEPVGHSTAGKPKIAFFQRREQDRKCLISADYKISVKAVAIQQHATIETLVAFLNKRCFFFVNINDGIEKSGNERKAILQNLFRVPRELGDKRPFRCERIPLPTDSRDFVRNYLYRSKPVIIENAINHWPALVRWNNDFLRAKYEDVKVHVKLTPNGEFEGCDLAETFENYESFKVPDAVKKQLRYPDLVVVRPAVGTMKFGEFLDLVEGKNIDGDGKQVNISAYLEYSSIREYFSELENDVEEIPFMHDMLKLSHLNMWLSNGNTLGKLHFDPFDNFLCQLRGSKKLTLFEPHNNHNLYEAHIQEALLSYDNNTKRFRHRRLLDSTSMVMSPIDLVNPDYDRFPNFTRANAMECVLNEGDVLFLPSFWWHEVQSFPNEFEHRNLAVNFWYKPFLTKEFPCPECKLDVNPIYRKLLSKFT